MAETPNDLITAFSKPLVGLPVSHFWRGYGSAVFVEFGDLAPAHPRADGSPGNPAGQMGLMIEWSWRIERSRSILCGSFSDESRWSKAFGKLVGATVSEVELFGRLPEISIGLSNKLHLTSFMTADGQPQWALFDRTASETRWLTVRNGRVVQQS